LHEFVCPALAGEGAYLPVGGIGTGAVPLRPDDILHTVQPDQGNLDNMKVMLNYFIFVICPVYLFYHDKHFATI